jgi:hypothetical protein
VFCRTRRWPPLPSYVQSKPLTPPSPQKGADGATCSQMTISKILSLGHCRPQLGQRSGSRGTGGSVSSLMTTGCCHHSRQVEHSNVPMAFSSFFRRCLSDIRRLPFVIKQRFRSHVFRSLLLLPWATMRSGAFLRNLPHMCPQLASWPFPARFGFAKVPVSGMHLKSITRPNASGQPTRCIRRPFW